MKLSTRIAMGFIFITLLGIILVVTTTILNNQRLNLTNQIKDVGAPLELMVQQVIGYDAILTGNAHWALLHAQKGEFDMEKEHKAKYDETGALLDKLLKTEARALLEKSERTQEIKDKVYGYLAELDRINLLLVDLETRAFAAMEKNDTETANALIVGKTYHDYKAELVQIYTDWGAVENGVTSSLREEIITKSNRINKINLYTTIFIAILTVFLSFLISTSISKPLKKLKEEVEEVSKGKLDIQLEKSNIKEVQSLADSLNRILSIMKLAVLRTGLTKAELGLGEAIKAKEEAEDRYKLLYETSNDAIMTIEPPNWKFTAGNPTAIKMFGVKSEKEFTTLGPWDVSPKNQPDGKLSSIEAKKMIMKAMKEGRAFFEWTHRKYRGESFPATILLTRFKLNGKDVVQATVRDIGEEKAMNLRESKATGRESAVTGRESKEIGREEIALGREEVVGKRETTATGREKMVGKREKIERGEGREGIALGREEVVGKRETTATGREQLVEKREKVATGRESKATGRESKATGRESKATGRESKATGREKEVRGREKIVGKREKIVRGREEKEKEK